MVNDNATTIGIYWLEKEKGKQGNKTRFRLLRLPKTSEFLHFQKELSCIEILYLGYTTFHVPSDRTGVDHLDPRRRTDRVCAADEAPAQASLLDLIREAGYICARRFRAIVILPAANRDCGTPRLDQCGAV